jgi:hypothetical protein
MDSGFRWNDEDGRLSPERKEKRKELDPGLRRDDEIKKRARVRADTNTIPTQPSP